MDQKKQEQPGRGILKSSGTLAIVQAMIGLTRPAPEGAEGQDGERKRAMRAPAPERFTGGLIMPASTRWWRCSPRTKERAKRRRKKPARVDGYQPGVKPALGRRTRADIRLAFERDA